MALLNDSGTYTWTIDRKLSNAKVGDKYQSDIFTIANYLKCRIKIYPNGNKDEFEGYSMVFLRILSMPNNWESVTICKTIESPQTKSQQTNMGIYTAGDTAGWKYVLPFNEIKHELLLELKVTLKIIRVTLLNKAIYYQYKLFYQKQLQITYKLGRSMIRMLKHCKVGKMVETDIFESMWCIRICPNGSSPQNNGKCSIGLTLCALPANVSRLKVRWALSCEAMNISLSQTADFSVLGTTKGCNIGTFKQFGKLDGLLLVIDITILKEYDNNGDAIIMNEDEECDDLEEEKEEKQQKITRTAIVNGGGVLKKEMNDKLSIYDSKINKMGNDIYIANDKIQKLTDLLIKTLEINKKKEETIKTLQSKLDELMEEEKEKNILMNNKLNSLNEEMVSLKQNRLRSYSNQSPLSPQESLKQFLEKEAKLSEYFDLFIENGFESLESLQDITMNDLQEIGISKLGHRKQIYKSITTHHDSFTNLNYVEPSQSRSYKYT